MTRVKVHPSVARAIDCLRSGGVALLPTDTVYGLAVRPTSPDGVDRIYAMKGRTRGKNLPVMVANPAALEDLGVALSPAAHRLLASRLIPGRVTMALGFRDEGVPSWLAGREEVAVRIPDHPTMSFILETVGPLLVTSANLASQATGESVDDIVPSLHEAPDATVDEGRLEVVPSTLVNCRLDPPVIERVGAVPAAAIEEVLR